MLKSKAAEKSEKTKTAEPTTTKKVTEKTKKGKYASQIQELRAQEAEIQGKIKELLIKQMNETNSDWEIGSTVYYPAPPQKVIIPCRLEIEEASNGDIFYFARPIVHKKSGEEELSKRHYSLGTDLSECEDLHKQPPKTAKKTAPAKEEKKSVKKSTPAADKKPAAAAEKTGEKKPLKKKTLGKKK